MKKLRLKESELIKLIERTINEQNPDVYWDCVNGNCEQGGTQFATEQECMDSNCEERARPGGYGGNVDKSRIRARALSEQGSYDSERSLTHDEFMVEADRYCGENKEGKGQFTGNRSCKRCKGEQLIRAYCAGKKKKELNENENWWEEDMIIAPCHSDCPPPWTPCGCLGVSQVTGIPPAELDPSMFDGNDDGFVMKNRDRLTRLGIAKFGRKGRGGRK